MRIGDIVEVAGQVAVRFGAVAVGLLAGTCTFSLLLLTFNLARAEAAWRSFHVNCRDVLFQPCGVPIPVARSSVRRSSWPQSFVALCLSMGAYSDLGFLDGYPRDFPPLHLDWYAQNVGIVWFVSGFGAGAAYWLVTGRKAGRWLGTTRAKATGLRSPP
jgi:hypothetical protein